MSFLVIFETEGGLYIATVGRFREGKPTRPEWMKGQLIAAKNKIPPCAITLLNWFWVDLFRDRGSRQ